MLHIFKKGVSAIAFASLMLILFASVGAQTFSGPGFTISDGGGSVPAGCSIVPVSGITTNVIVNQITYSNFAHTWIGDLEMRAYLPGAAAPPSITNSQIISSPPNDRDCNFNGTYNFTNGGASSVDAATVGCADATDVPAGNYRTSNYGGGVNPGPVTNLNSLFGVLTPAQANGNWLVCAFDFSMPDGGSVGATSISLSVFTAAGASISGRVITMSGRGVAGVPVIVTDSAGNSRTAISNSFGAYYFESNNVGETYVITANHKKYQFQNPTQIVNLSESISGLDFITANK